MKWYTEWQETTRKIMKIMADYFHWLLLSLGSSLFPDWGAVRNWAGVWLHFLGFPWSVVSHRLSTQELPELWGTRSVPRSPLLWVVPDTLTQQHWIIPKINPPSHSTQTLRRALITFYRCWATRNFSCTELSDQNDIQGHNYSHMRGETCKCFYEGKNNWKALEFYQVKIFSIFQMKLFICKWQSTWKSNELKKKTKLLEL